MLFCEILFRFCSDNREIINLFIISKLNWVANGSQRYVYVNNALEEYPFFNPQSFSAYHVRIPLNEQRYEVEEFPQSIIYLSEKSYLLEISFLLCLR